MSRPFAAEERARAEDLDRKEPRFSATRNGFDVHCAVRVEAGDDVRRERLVRYCARPPFALERIELMKDGRVAYRLKTPRRGKTHRVMTPVEFLGRLAILVPPPYFPLVRYHGVFGARSSWRALVTPKPRDGVARRKKAAKACSDDRQEGAPSAPTAPVPVPAASTPQAGANDAAKDAAKAPPQAAATTAAPTTAAAVMSAPSTTPGASALRAVAISSDDPTMITIEHWRRLLDGELYAASSRVEWALLLRRTYGVDALRCTSCGGRMRVMATITEPSVVKKILSHLNLPTEPLPRARARDPTGQETFDFDAA